MTNTGFIGMRAKYIKTEECEKVVVIWLWYGIFKKGTCKNGKKRADGFQKSVAIKSGGLKSWMCWDLVAVNKWRGSINTLVEKENSEMSQAIN